MNVLRGSFTKQLLAQLRPVRPKSVSAKVTTTSMINGMLRQWSRRPSVLMTTMKMNPLGTRRSTHTLGNLHTVECDSTNQLTNQLTLPFPLSGVTTVSLHTKTSVAAPDAASLHTRASSSRRVDALLKFDDSFLSTLTKSQLREEQLLDGGFNVRSRPVFPNDASEFVFMRTYARWIDELKRRETWDECVDRVMAFYRDTAGDKVPERMYAEIRHQILHFGTMPSMRLAWTAGLAATLENVCAYNCSFVPVMDTKAFAEILYISMCGTGVGFSVEQEFIKTLPTVMPMSSIGCGIHVVGDSREGWASAFLAGLNAWYAGKDIEFDYSQVRPRGARLKTMGGRASGPEPLKALFEFTRSIMIKAQGRPLTSLEVHDIVCKEAEIVVVGGVRRSSLISFTDLDDEAMRGCKTWPIPPHRFMANISAVYHKKPDSVTFLKEWSALASSGTGERGIYNISNLGKYAKRRDFTTHRHRSNPCGEIILRPFQFCNLTEVVVRSSDTFDDLIQKVKVAVWMGSIQSMLTKFHFIRDDFRKNCEEERLLGVSLTGQMDNPALMTAEKLDILKSYAIKEARRVSKKLGINMSTSITTGKPSGTVSQLVDSASGCHPRFAPFYIRRYRIAATDPLYRMLKSQGFTFTPENGESKSEWVRALEAHSILQSHIDSTPHWPSLPHPDLRKLQSVISACAIFNPNDAEWDPSMVRTWIVAFPTKSPEGAITRHNMSASDQAAHYMTVQNNWCEHNQSTTLYIKEHEWPAMGAKLYDKWDDIVGVSCLPDDGGHYQQPPYEEIDEPTYREQMRNFPKADYSQLGRFETSDHTTGAQTLACGSGSCELL